MLVRASIGYCMALLGSLCLDVTDALAQPDKTLATANDSPNAAKSADSGVQREQRDQSDNQSDQRDKLAAERYLQVLFDRPQPGTALDRLMEYHRANGGLDAFIKQLMLTAKANQASAPDLAARQWFLIGLMEQSQSRWRESLDALRLAATHESLKSVVSDAQAAAFEHLQQWSEVIAVLEPTLAGDHGQSKTALRSRSAYLEASQRLAAAYTRLGRSEDAFKVWRQMEHEFVGDLPMAKKLSAMAAEAGEIGFAIGVIDRALPHLKQAVQQVELSITRASLLARQGDWEAALADYNQLLERSNPGSWLSNDLLARTEALVLDQEGFDGLIAFYQRWLSKRPDDVHVMTRLAETLVKQGRWDAAKQQYEALLERSGRDTAPRVAYARALAERGLWSDASVVYGKLHELEPRNRDWLVQWGAAVLADKTLEESVRVGMACDIWERQLIGAENNLTLLDQVASLLESNGQRQRAIKLLERSHTIARDDVSIASHLARALVADQRRDRALSVLNNVQQSVATAGEQLAQLADTYLELEFHQAAIDCLSAACRQKISVALRCRLINGLVNVKRLEAALEQINLAWDEVPKETGAIPEQDALYEKVMQCHLGLLKDQPALQNEIDWLNGQLSSSTNRSCDRQRGLWCWRLASIYELAQQTQNALNFTVQSAELDSMRPLFWRTRAQLEDRLGKTESAIASYKHLAEIDPRKRSEYLLNVADCLVKRGRAAEALQITQSVVDLNTASSQVVLRVFDLALAAQQRESALKILQQRMQYKPEDVEVLQRLIDYLESNLNIQQASQFGWQLFELHDQPEQRLVTLQRLLPWHTTMGTLDQLDKLLDSFWRRRDLVHEYRVWQCLMAIQRSQHEKAEALLLVLSKRPATRAFALEQLIKLADVRGQSDRRLEWRMELLAVDPQTINFQELAECLISAEISQPVEVGLNRTLTGLQPPQRLALLDEVLHKGEFSLALNLIAAFPPEERSAWPVAIRQLHATSSIQWPTSEASGTTSDAPEPVRWERVSQQLCAQSFGLSATANETQLIETVLDGRVILQDYLCERLLQREGFPLTTAFHMIASRCQSPVHAYQLALAIELDHVLEASQRRSLLQRHRELALAQSDAREAATRLFCLALVSAWELELPKAKVPGSSARVAMPGQRPSNQQQAQAALRRKQVLLARPTSVGPQMVQRLQAISRYLEPVVLEMQDVANRGDGLAALLSLWIEAGKGNSQRFQGAEALPTAAREMAMRHWRCLGSYARYAPLEVVCDLVVALCGCGQSDSGREIFASLCQILDSEEAFRQLLLVALNVQDESLSDTLVKYAFDRKFEISSLVGHALSSRALAKHAPESVLPLLDRSWHSEVVSGKRQLKILTLLNDQATPEWMSRLPVSTLRFHETNLFTQNDLGAMRALISQSRTTDARLRLLTEIRRLGDQPADPDLQLTRRLAGCVLHELLEQDTQADQLLDQALPQASPGPAGWLRALWLDTLGKRDAAISELAAALSSAKSKSTSGHVAVDAHVSEQLAVLLLEWSIASHNPSARIAAIEHLKASAADLTPYTPLVATLLDKNLLVECELLLGDFSVFVPPSYLPNYEVYRKVVAKDERLLPQNDAWPLLRQDLERSLLLIELMSKQLAARDIDSGFRLASRILSSAQHATEYAEVNTDEALHRLFQSQIQDRSLRLSFLIGVGKRLLVNGSSVERLQMACMLRREGEGKLSQSLMDLVDNHELSSAQLMKRAIYEMECEQFDQAAVTVIQALDGHPELMDATIGQFPIQIEMVGVQLANALQQHPALATAVGDETLRKLLPHIQDSLSQFEPLLLMWAKNPKHQRFDLIQLVWEKLTDEPELARAVLEQMLQAGGINELLLLQALEPPRVNSSRLPGTAPQAPRMPTTIVFYPRFRPPTLERFQSQLIEICQRRPDDFVCQLFLLMHAIQTKQHTLVSQQVTRLAALPLVERSTDVARARLLKLVANQGIFASGTGVAGLGTSGNQGIPGAAAGLPTVEASALLEVALNYASPHDQSLTDSVRDLLMLHYAMQGESEKLLEQLQMKLPPMLTSNHRSLLSDSQVGTTLPNSSVQMITTYPAVVPRQVVLAMQHPKLTWARSLLLTRAAQLEQQLKRKSSIYAAWRPADRAVGESLVRLDNEIIDQYFVLASEALMRADWHPNQMTAWHKCVLPMLVHAAPWELESVSLLDTIWPRSLADSADQLPVDQLPADLLVQLRERLHGQITDVGMLGRWQTLGWCHLAMRLGDQDLSNALLDRLLMLANQKLPGQKTSQTVTSQSASQTLNNGAVANTPETQWRLALWTVATLPSDVVGLDAKRFQLAEVARNTAQSSRNSRLALAIGLTQLAWIDQASPEIANELRVALNMQLDESLSMNNVAFASNWSKRAQLDSGMAVVKSLVKSRQLALAIDTLERLVSSQHVAARAQGFLGIMPRSNLKSQLLDKPYDLADEVRAMVDSGIEPRRLQVLLEKAMFARLSVKGMPAGQLGPWVEPRPFKLPTDNQPPEAAKLPTNLISELLRLAISNHELAELKRRATQAAEAEAANTSVLCLLCLIAVHESDLPEAVNRYEQLLAQNAQSESDFARQLREQNGVRAMFELDADIARLSIVNALHKKPLEPFALKFSLLVLNDPTKQRQCDHWSSLLMRQLSLAIDQPTTAELFQLCDWLRSRAFVLRTTLHERQQLRSQLALTCLDKGYADRSIWAYGRLIDAQTPISSLDEDPYRIELFRVLPTLPAAEQAAILERCFLNSAANQFPWLMHDMTPEVEPIAARFDGQAQGRGLINQAAITERKTISLATWIVDVARQHTKQTAVLEALESQRIHWTTMGQAWGAAVIAIQLDDSLTTEELNQWLSDSRQANDLPVMHALLEACQTQTGQNHAAQNQVDLRAVVTERVFNLGHLDIVSAATARPAPLNLKHWLAVSEPQSTRHPTSEPKTVQGRESAHSHAGSNAARPSVSGASSHMPTQRGRQVWSVNQENELTALPSRTPAYLILRYPLAEGCEFMVNVEQVSGEKFGIGYGGLTIAQHTNPGRARYLGTNARSFNAVAGEFSLDQPNASLKVTIGPNSSRLEYPGGRLEDTIVPSSSMLYLFNQGPGTARYREFKLSHTSQDELQFLPQIQLFDPQLRLWRDMLGGTSLPKLWLSGDDRRQMLDQPGSTTCQVNDGVLSFRGPLDSAMTPDYSAIQFLRPLMAGESVEYEFYHTTGSASIVPVLGRLAFRLHPNSTNLQWLVTPEERTWLSLKSTGQVELDPQERLADPALQANAWNKVRVLREANSQVLVELNGQPIVRTELSPSAVYQFGLMYCPDKHGQPAQGQPIQPGLVRRGTLTGPWQPKLSSDQLMERD